MRAFCIVITGKSYLSLYSKIKPWVIESMQYKLPARSLVRQDDRHEAKENTCTIQANHTNAVQLSTDFDFFRIRFFN